MKNCRSNNISYLENKAPNPVMAGFALFLSLIFAIEIALLSLNATTLIESHDVPVLVSLVLCVLFACICIAAIWKRSLE